MTISKEDLPELKELSFYLSKISSHEKLVYKSEIATVSKVFGMIIILAGFADESFNLT